VSVQFLNGTSALVWIKLHRRRVVKQAQALASMPALW